MHLGFVKAKSGPVSRVLFEFVGCTKPKHRYRFCFKKQKTTNKIFDRGPGERRRWFGFLRKALRTHLCYRTRQILQGQRIKAREKNKNRNKNWRQKGREKTRELKEHSEYVSNSRGRHRGSVCGDRRTCVHETHSSI